MKYFSALFLGIWGLAFFQNISAQQVPVLEFYHGAECPHCHEEKEWFPMLQKMYPDLKIEEYEVWHNPVNQKKAQARLEALGQKFSGVPTNVIDDQIVVGFSAEKILEVMAAKYGPPAEVPEEENSVTLGTNLEDFFSSNGIFVVITVVVLGVVGVLFGKKQ